MKDTQLGLALRDGGAETALANAGEDWHTTAVNLVLQYFGVVGRDGALFEEARTYATMCGIGAPPSPNAWGAVALSLSKRNLITKTGDLLPSKDARSHARSQPVWRLTNIGGQPAVPDAFGTREGEHPQYVQGWNDCRAEMLKARSK